MDLSSGQLRELRLMGISGECSQRAQAELLDRLKPFISDIVGVSLKELIMIGRAVLVKPDYTMKQPDEPTVNDQPEPEEISYKEKVKNRKRVRINLKVDSSYALPLLEHLSRFDGIESQEVNTGLSVKHQTKYGALNILTYNHLRCLNKEMFGHLYLNVVRNDDEFYRLGIDYPHTYFRGYIAISDVNIYELINMLTRDNINILKELSVRSMSRRDRNARSLQMKLK